MNSILCLNCAKALPESANYCANCGESMTSPGHVSLRFLAEKPSEQDAFKAPHFYPLSNSQVETPSLPGKRRSATVNVASHRSHLGTTYPLHPSQQTSPQGGQRYPVQDVLTQSLPEERSRPLTWQKVLDTPPVQEDVPLAPRPSQLEPIALTPLSTKKRTVGRIPPAFFFWASLISLLVLLLGGVFGIFVTFGRGIFDQPGTGTHAPTLQASSSTIAIGATLTLRGSNFHPHGQVGLTRDAIIPIADTGGFSIIRADGKGDFTDTITVSSDWQAGIHTINAEDASMHKIARFSLVVTGQSISLRPAHLTISATTLDLGTGDLATNSTQTITLSNVGGGQITWQGSADQPWLLFTPNQGTFAAGAQAQVTIAVDRSTLKPGPYNAHINFLSNAGDSSVAVSMQVVPLDPGHNAVLVISPSVLSFTATDGGTAPPTQTITVSNPGVRPLQWGVSTNVAWLAVSPESGNVQNASSADGVSASTTAQGGATQSVSVGINTSTLLPGTYSGMITFSSQGTEQVKDSPQNALVTITISPQCSLQVSPSLIAFAGVYAQPSPANKSISVGISQGCTTPIQWSATTASPWLVLGTSSGTTPTYPSVGVNSAGLTPGSYTGSIVFSTSAGTETIPVTFTLAQPATPIMTVSTATLAYNGVVGQAGPAPQSVIVTNTVGGTLNWQAAVATTIGGNWLSVAPASGSLTAHQSASLSVTATQLNTLTPGTYNGTITITGDDGAGHAAPGSPQVIPVSFVVQAACAITTGPTSLTFAGVVGQTASTPQTITITASGACVHAIDWTATPAASGNWLVPTPATGVATLATAGTSSVGVALTGLAAGNYQSTLTVTAIDSVTHQAIGTPVGIAVALTVQQACTLQAPSVATEAFTTEAGQDPAVQTFSLAVSGACTGNVIITPTITLGKGRDWLTVTPATATVLTGSTATFTMTVHGTAMKAGSYGGSISLAGVNGGVTIAGSPQTVGITVTVTAPPALAASAGRASTHSTDGVTSQPVNIANTGDTSLNWTVALASGPSFVSLSPVSGTLAGGTNTAASVVVDATGVASGSYTANVTVTATDPTTGQATGGSPTTVPITITIAPPAMQMSATALTFSTPAGTDPTAQSITISNSGGGTLTWTAGTPDATWLTVGPTSGSDAPNASSTLTFNVSVSGLAAGTYPATVVITPSVGSAVTVNVTLTVVAVTPSPTPTTNAIPSPTPTVGITPTPTVGITPTPTP
ncbi:MAG: hypothetical protein NVS4B11_35870 [Ktedonobacteraceae bacterium]